MLILTRVASKQLASSVVTGGDPHKIVLRATKSFVVGVCMCLRTQCIFWELTVL